MVYAYFGQYITVLYVLYSQYKVRLDRTGRVTLRNRVALRWIVPYGVSVPIGGGLELERSAGTGVQEGPRTLHSKAFLKPKTGEVVVGSSPTLDSLTGLTELLLCLILTRRQWRKRKGAAL